MNEVTGPDVHGSVNVPRGWLTEIACPFTTAVTVAASPRSKRSVGRRAASAPAAVVSIETGWSSETVPSEVVAVTTAT